MDLLNDANKKPVDMTSTPDIVIVLGLSNRRALRRQRRVVGVESHLPCSMREMTGLTRMPPAQVSP